jgi:hypothetical protein
LNKYENVGLDTVRGGGEVLQEAVKWMDEVKDDRFFAWLHFYDVHTPTSPGAVPLPIQGLPWGPLRRRDRLPRQPHGELFDWLDKADLEDDTS